MGVERERNRIKSRMDEFPEEIVDLVNQRLSNVSITYSEIAEELSELGYEISKSSIGRYASRQNKIAERLKRSFERTRALIETVKENQDMQSGDIASAIAIDHLTQRMAAAEEDFENMPIDKAGRLLVSLQRTAVYKEKFRLEYKKGIKDAVDVIKIELRKELAKEPELLKRLVELTEKAANRLEGESNG